jgi:hypothetical protein
MTELKTSFDGRKLCRNCWNGAHWTEKTDKRTGRKLGVKTPNCLGDPCECLCREMLKEIERVKVAEAEKAKVEYEKR